MTFDLITHFSVERILDTMTASKQDTFYNVFAHGANGRRMMIIRMVNSQHAHFILQELQGYLDLQSETQLDTTFTQTDDVHNNNEHLSDINDFDYRLKKEPCGSIKSI